MAKVGWFPFCEECMPCESRVCEGMPDCLSVTVASELDSPWLGWTGCVWSYPSFARGVPEAPMTSLPGSVMPCTPLGGTKWYGDVPYDPALSGPACAHGSFSRLLIWCNPQTLRLGAWKLIPYGGALAPVLCGCAYSSVLPVEFDLVGTVDGWAESPSIGQVVAKITISEGICVCGA